MYIDYKTEMKPTPGYATRCKTVCGFSMVLDPGYSTIGNNCTSYAMDTWEENTGEDLRLGIDWNYDLGIAIDNMNLYNVPWGPNPNPSFFNPDNPSWNSGSEDYIRTSFGDFTQ